MDSSDVTIRPSSIAFPRTWTKLSSHGFNSDWEPTSESFFDKSRKVRVQWSSRNHRKGIPAKVDDEAADDPESSGTSDHKWKIKRRSYRWIGSDVWDISWWIGIIFTVGSVFWCVNAILFFVYFDRTTTPYTNTEAATAFLGGSTFLIGAYLGWVESLNPARDADFGWEVDEMKKTFFEPKHAGIGHCLGRRRHHFGRHHEASSPQHPSVTEAEERFSSGLAKLENPHASTQHANGPNTSTAALDTVTRVNSNSNKRDTSSERTMLMRPADGAKKDDAAGSTGQSQETTDDPSSKPDPAPWRWYGRAHSLAYVANTIQLFGAIVFEISVLCGLPGVLPISGNTGGPEQGGKSEGLWIALYWSMQVVGAPCFVIAGAMFALETQRKWWLPNVTDIGWQVGFWNFVGGMGFWFSGIFGIWRQSSLSNPNLYQYWGTAFSTFWGSWAFLIGSYIQLWEGINKIP